MADLNTLFSSLPHQDVLFVRPGGNWGDYLIYRGAELLAERHGLRVTTLDYAEFVAAPARAVAALYLHGSGGFNRWTSGRARSALIHALASYPCPIIQGPMTIADDPDYQRELAELALPLAGNRPVHLFARERRSYDALEAVFDTSAINIHIDQDTALHATRADLIRPGAPTGRYHLNALRNDNEQTGHEASFKASDSGITLDPAIYARSFDHWVKIHAASGSIRTNRTHSAIAGAILGVPTTMFASSSHKNRSIWEHSLEGRGVKWINNGHKTGPAEAPSRQLAGQHSSKIRDAARPHLRRLTAFKRLARPFYRVVNLPRVRARAASRLAMAKKWLKRLDNTRRGVPWK